MPTICLTIEYDGTDFHGWQRQASARTVQSAIEQAIHQVSGTRRTVFGSGRTDAGVHAAGQVAHFTTLARHTPATWRKALNAVLPSDVAVTDACEVPDGFHSRFAAVRKHYRYTIFNRPTRSPLLRKKAWHIQSALDVRSMRLAARRFLGHQDFQAFQGADPSHHSGTRTVCSISRCAIRKANDLIIIDIESNRFLKYMVRNIVGTLVEVGRKRRTPQDIARIIASKDRRNAGVRAPAHGLTLMQVWHGAQRKRKTSGGRPIDVSGRSPETYSE